MATPPTSSKLAPSNASNAAGTNPFGAPGPKPPVAKNPSPITSIDKLIALQDVYKLMLADSLEMRKTGSGPLAIISNAPRGTTEDSNNAYRELERLHARFYMALRSCVGIPTEEILTGFSDKNPDIAVIPNMNISEQTQEGASELTRIQSLVDSRLTNIFTPDYSYKLDPEETDIDLHIAQHIDKRRKELIKASQERLKALEQSRTAGEESEYQSLKTFLANIDSPKQLSMASLVKTTNQAIEATDKHFLERMSRLPLKGWINASEHDEEHKKYDMFGLVYKLFDHPRFHVHASLNNDGEVNVNVARLSMFSEVGAMLGIGQMMGAYYEQIIFKRPVYTYETDPKTGKQILSRDESGQPIPKKDKGKIVYEYDHKNIDDAFKQPFPLGRVPGGFAGPAFRALMDATVINQMMGGPGVHGFDPSNGYSAELVEELTKNMSPGAKSYFEVMVHRSWKEGLAKAQDRFQKEVILPYFESLAREELRKEGKLGYAQKFNPFDNTLAERTAALQEAMIGGGVSSAAKRDANIAYIARQRFMRVGARDSSLTEAQKMDEKEDSLSEAQKMKDSVPELLITDSAFSAQAGENEQPELSKRAGGIVHVDDEETELESDKENLPPLGGIVHVDNDATSRATLTGSNNQSGLGGIVQTEQGQTSTATITGTKPTHASATLKKNMQSQVDDSKKSTTHSVTIKGNNSPKNTR